MKSVKVFRALGGDARDQLLRRDASALSMIGAPWASSAQTKCTSRGNPSLSTCMRWNRTQISAWMYSMMWPM
jgi:hypothetical protein